MSPLFHCSGTLSCFQHSTTILCRKLSTPSPPHFNTSAFNSSHPPAASLIPLRTSLTSCSDGGTPPPSSLTLHLAKSLLTILAHMLSNLTSFPRSSHALAHSPTTNLSSSTHVSSPLAVHSMGMATVLLIMPLTLFQKSLTSNFLSSIISMTSSSHFSLLALHISCLYLSLHSLSSFSAPMTPMSTALCARSLSFFAFSHSSFHQALPPLPGLTIL